VRPEANRLVLRWLGELVAPDRVACRLRADTGPTDAVRACVRQKQEMS